MVNMEFKLEENEEIIFEFPSMISTKFLLGSYVLCFIASISLITLTIGVTKEYLIQSTILILVIYIHLQSFTFKSTLTNKRLLYRNLFFIPCRIDLKKIISIGMFYRMPSFHFGYIGPKFHWIEFKINGRFFSTYLIVQDGEKFRNRLLAQIKYMEDKKLNQNQIKKNLFYKLGIMK